MTTSIIKSTNQLNSDQLADMIIKESRRQAKKYQVLYPHVDRDEMESWLVSKVYFEILEKPDFHNIKGLRHMINKRSIDFVRDQSKRNVEMSFSTMITTCDDNEDLANFDSYNNEETAQNFQTPSAEEIVIENEEMQTFLESLPLIERQVVELTAGICTSLDRDQLHKVKTLIDKKSAKEKNITKEINVWFTATEIGSILGLSRRQIQHPLTKMKEKALDFGLWDQI